MASLDNSSGIVKPPLKRFNPKKIHSSIIASNTSMSYNHTNNGFFSVPEPSLDPMFQCLWSGPDGSRSGCSYPFFAHELSAHLCEYHGIRGGDKSRVRCSWDDCNKELNKENLSRHVEERHLRITHPCNTCNKTFTRKYNLNHHMKRCLAQQQ